jgi:adenosylcobinamide-phosphate guanylyltransferase
MYAVLMAGGRGKRLILDFEKPILIINGRTMIERIIDELRRSDLDGIYVCTTKDTPLTERLVSHSYEEKVKVINTAGLGYIEDMRECAKKADMEEPFIYISADLPLINFRMINYIISFYESREEDALSVFLKREVYDKYDIETEMVLHYRGEEIVPVGINIINGKRIEEEQEEYKLILDIPELAFNINRIVDYERLRCSKIEDSSAYANL